MSIFRLSGAVEARGDRPWSKGERSGVIPQASVRVNDFVVTDVTLADAMVGVQRGEVVDLIVDVSASGGFVRATAVGYWPRDADAQAPADVPANSPVSLSAPPVVNPARRSA